jgi:hypothetical protein
MASSPFQLQIGETILYQTRPQRSWYTLAWRVLSNLLGMALLIALLFVFLSVPTAALLGKVLSSSLAAIVSQTLFLGLLPLLALVWVVEEAISAFTGALVLTDRRMWVSGSPYAWSQGETPLEDVASVTYRRDGIFVRQKSTRKVQVHMFPEGKLVVKAYEDFTGKGKPAIPSLPPSKFP